MTYVILKITQDTIKWNYSPEYLYKPMHDIMYKQP